ncbi:hypothetical protein BaRGS_00035605, partial [Batillaria attramentaria]
IRSGCLAFIRGSRAYAVKIFTLIFLPPLQHQPDVPQIVRKLLEHSLPIGSSFPLGLIAPPRRIKYNEGREAWTIVIVTSILITSGPLGTRPGVNWLIGTSLASHA